MPEFSGGSGGGVMDPPTAQGLPPSTPEDAAGLRCMICNIDWPIIPALWDVGTPPDYSITEAELHTFMENVVSNVLKCPVCEDDLTVANNLNPIPDEEAFSLKRHADFDRYYERTRGVAADAD
jgi:hypothetical protein